MGILTVVDGTIDTDGPHTRGIPVAITIILLSAVPGRPNVDIAQSVSTLMETHEQTSDIDERIEVTQSFSLFFSMHSKEVKN